eukprot:6200018-Pleurochrysis_carterae.AAC.1
MPYGALLWNLATLPHLVPRGRVRVSDKPTFVFCKEDHPLVRDQSFPAPSVTMTMETAEFVRRLQLHTFAEAGTSPPPLRYSGAPERYYMQVRHRSHKTLLNQVLPFGPYVCAATCGNAPTRVQIEEFSHISSPGRFCPLLLITTTG